MNCADPSEDLQTIAKENNDFGAAGKSREARFLCVSFEGEFMMLTRSVACLN